MRSLLASKLPPSLRPAPETGAGAVSLVPSSLPLRRFVTAGVVAGLALLAVRARHSLGGAGGDLRKLHPLPLGVGAAALAVTFAASAAAWRSALRAAGAPVRFREAWGCYGAGSLANAVLPARLGEAVRVGLFAGRLPCADARWVSGGAWLAVAAARAAVYALACAAAGLLGVLPTWTLVGPAGAAVGLAAAVLALRGRGAGPFARFGLRRTLTPRAGAALLAWVTLGAAARLTGAACVLHSLEVANPLTTAFVGLAAMALAASVPFAPGGAGVAGAAMAVALERSGVATGTAVASAVAFHAVETLTSVAFGSGGWVALRATGRPVLPPAASETSQHAVSVLPRQRAAALRAPGRGGARRAPRRGGHPLGVRAAHVPARAIRRRNHPAGDHAGLLPSRRRRVHRVHGDEAVERAQEEPEGAEAP